jgi:hypothetical protein
MVDVPSKIPAARLRPPNLIGMSQPPLHPVAAGGVAVHGGEAVQQIGAVDQPAEGEVGDRYLGMRHLPLHPLLGDQQSACHQGGTVPGGHTSG